jgi:[ribosomal protein S5]-alanine N-acetyltransferase
MTIKPILIDEDSSLAIYNNEFCKEIFTSYPAYYHKTGYNPPWIGYFIIRDTAVVGVGGFTGAPKNGRVEIAYGTSKEFEDQGIASFVCRQLISISQTTDPSLIITAKTAPENNASTKILSRNGFIFTGIVQDEDIGDAWEWVLTK